MILTILNTICIFVSCYFAYKAYVWGQHGAIIALNIAAAVLNLVIVLSRTGLIG